MTERRRHGDRFNTVGDDGAINYEELPTSQVSLDESPLPTPSGAVVNLHAARRRPLAAAGYDPLEQFTPVPDRNTQEQPPAYSGPDHFAHHANPAPGELTAPIDTNTFHRQMQAAAQGRRAPFSRLSKPPETAPAFALTQTPLTFAPPAPPQLPPTAPMMPVVQAPAPQQHYTPPPPPPYQPPQAYAPPPQHAPPQYAQPPQHHPAPPQHHPAPPQHRPPPPRRPPLPQPAPPPQHQPQLAWGTEHTEGSYAEHTGSFEVDAYEQEALRGSPVFLLMAIGVGLLVIGAVVAFFVMG